MIPLKVVHILLAGACEVGYLYLMAKETLQGVIQVKILEVGA